MHALRNIHDALAPDGILVDTQPVSAWPPVASGGDDIGTLDMRDWLATIHAVDELVAETIAGGLYALEHESWLVVTDTYDDGPECLEIVAGWRGTHVPPAVSQRLAAASRRVTVQQEVRLRLLRRETLTARVFKPVRQGLRCWDRSWGQSGDAQSSVQCETRTSVQARTKYCGTAPRE